MVYYYEQSTSRMAKLLTRFPYYGTDKVLNLLQYQDTQEQFIISEKHLEDYFERRTNQFTTSEKLSIYLSLFKGRRDVYAKSYIDDKGKINYFPSYNYGWKTLPIEKRTYQTLTEQVLKGHFRGDTSIGMFPISQSDTCSFLAIDFDEKDWREAVSIVRRTAERYSLEAHVEISRSGEGAHVWFFFEEEIACKQARNVGQQLLDLSMQESKSVSFASFDRMFPNQDVLPKGGFGNLIALPLQGEAVSKGRTVFVDRDFQPYADQWAYLQQVQKLTRHQIQDFLGEKRDDSQDERQLSVSLSNTIRVKKDTISAKTNHLLRKLASFSNPEFYLKQAMRQPTYQTPERIYLFEENETELRLPRGLLVTLRERFEELELTDEQYSLSPIRVSFNGQLRFDQEVALADLLGSDNGLLSATTGFGKTVLAAALIAKRQRKTIILVHNRQLLEQWLERLSDFLLFEEAEAVRFTPSGREKVIGHIGQYGAARKWRSKLVDVVMIQSLFQLDNVASFLSAYDMMIVDECHHVTAIQFEKVVAQFSGRYLYGLTATPERKNGHEPIIFQRIGPILHTASPREDHFEKRLSLRLTSFGKLNSEQSSSTSFPNLNDWLAKDPVRNNQVCRDIEQLYQENRKIIALVNRVEHLDTLEKLLVEKNVPHVFCLSGRSKRKEAKKLLDRVMELDDASPFVLLSTGKYIGEGFDLPKLDTLVLVAPLSWKNNLIQYAGRLHRPYQGKAEVRIVDYLDIHVPYLEKMYQKRQIAYRKMAYQLGDREEEQVLFTGADYQERLKRDLQEGSTTAYFQLGTFSVSKIGEMLGLMKDKQVIVQVPEEHPQSKWLKGLETKNLKVQLSSERIGTTLIIVDKSIVWYGNLSPYSHQLADEASLLRLESQAIAEELLERFGNQNEQ